MKEIFYRSPNLSHRRNKFYAQSRNRGKFGNKSCRSTGEHIWNSLPENNKSTKILCHAQST